MADDDATARRLIDRAVELADRLDVRYLELRHERAVDHPACRRGRAQGPHAAAAAGDTAEELWERHRRRRSATRSARGRSPAWRSPGGARSCCRSSTTSSADNMRDLGTPVFGRALFRAIAPPVPRPRRVLRRPRRRPAGRPRPCCSTAGGSPRSPAPARCGGTTPPAPTC